MLMKALSRVVLSMLALLNTVKSLDYMPIIKEDIVFVVRVVIAISHPNFQSPYTFGDQEALFP